MLPHPWLPHSPCVVLHPLLFSGDNTLSPFPTATPYCDCTLNSLPSATMAATTSWITGTLQQFFCSPFPNHSYPFSLCSFITHKSPSPIPPPLLLPLQPSCTST